MIIEGEAIRRHNYVEMKMTKEIRPGRRLACRKITIDRSNNSVHNNTSNDGTASVIILFIHGSLAASMQFDDLLASLSNIDHEKKIDCYLYDQLGCGESVHPSNDWYAFSSTEHANDLETIVKSIIETMDVDSKLYLVGHSYGVSQTITLLHSLEPAILNRVGGAVLISGGLKDGPSELTNDGGHWIFRYMPMFILNMMQPGLSKNFIDAAIHPNNEELKKSAIEFSNKNDMAICKAFYRQQRYASAEEARAVSVSISIMICLP